MKIKLKNVRITFANGLFTSKLNQSGKASFSSTFLFKKESETNSALAKVIDEVGSVAFAKEWPGIKKKKQATDKLVIHDGDNQAKYDGYEGNLYVIAYNSVRPDVRAQDATPLAEVDGEIYSGCYVDAIVDVSAYNSKTYGPQLSVTLLGVQLRSKGPALGNGAVTAAESDFEAITEGADAEDLA